VTKHLIILAGLALYLTSFFLVAVSAVSASGGIHGYHCAWLTLIIPWGRDGMNVLHEQPVQYFSILLSGWINPIFLIIIVLQLLRKKRFANIFTVVLILLFPFCWIIFYQEHMHPVTGYFLWILGMLLVVLSGRFGGSHTAASAA
jgi:hypothetical protein